MKKLESSKWIFFQTAKCDIGEPFVGEDGVQRDCMSEPCPAGYSCYMGAETTHCCVSPGRT